MYHTIHYALCFVLYAAIERDEIEEKYGRQI